MLLYRKGKFINMTDSIAVLGSTGSVGLQALDVAKFHNIRVKGISASSSVKIMEEQIRQFRPEYVAVEDEHAAKKLRESVRDIEVKHWYAGKGASEELAGEVDCSTVLNSITGVAGLRPSLAAIRSGKNLALANKETLVTAGELIISEADKNSVDILPVDSEHSAIFQCLQGNKGNKVKKLLLTASGGPFFGKTIDELRKITIKSGLVHPTWNMGPRITIDSSTLMNKGFEVIEAIRLFGVKPEQVEVLVHRESIIHSMVEYIDNAVIAQLSVPDMRLCIQYALTYPERTDSPMSELDLFEIGNLSFYKPDTKSFPLLQAAFDAVKFGGTAPAALNGADEQAVKFYLEGKIDLFSISELVIEATKSCGSKDEVTVETVEKADKAARNKVIELVNSL